MLERGFKPGKWLRLSEGVAAGILLFALVLTWVRVGPAWSLPSERAWEQAWKEGPDGFPSAPKVNDFGSWIHEAGNLALRVSNVGVFGANWIYPAAYVHAPYPSAEWPSGSGNDYLWAAGLWVGGITSEGDTLVTAAVYQGEFFPAGPSLDRVRESSECSPGGEVGRGPNLPAAGPCGGSEYPAGSCDFFAVGEGDDDGDGLYDEDFLDGYDNDGDGFVDEDYAAYSAEMLASVYYDTTDWFNVYVANPDDQHHPMNLRVEQRSYAWHREQTNDFVGVDYTVINMDTSRSIHNAYVGLMVDPDCGPNVYGSNISRDDWSDYVEFDTMYTAPGSTNEECPHISMAFAWDDPGGDDGGDATGIIGVMFLGHNTDELGQSAPSQVGIHAYKNWSGAGEDPENDGYRYRYLRGSSDVIPSIDPKTPVAADWRFLVSAGPFAELSPGDSISFQVAFVAGERHPEMDNYPAGDHVAKRRFLGTLIDHAIEAQRVFDNCWRTPGEEPSAVDLVSFSATHFGDRVEVEWKTGVEIDNVGFRLYRGFQIDGPYAPVNEQLIPPMTTAVEGASYSFTDSDVARGVTCYYRLEDLDVHGVATIHGPVAATPGSVAELPIPTVLNMAQNDPNPFNTGTVIRYGVPAACDVRLTVYNLAGQRVRTLVNEHQSAGYRVVRWDGRNESGVEVSGGVYFYELRAGSCAETRKMVLLR